MLSFFCPRRAASQSRPQQSGALSEEPQQQPLNVIPQRELTPLQQWRASAKRLENFERLLALESSIETVVGQLTQYKKEQVDRYSFVSLLKCYRGWLERQLTTSSSELAVRILQQQLQLTALELNLAAIVEGLFSYFEVERLRSVPGKELIRFIAEKVASIGEKKAMLLTLAESCYRDIKEFLLQYLQFSLDPSDSIFQIFLFSAEEERSLRVRGIVLDSCSLVLEVVMVLARSYHNYDLAVRLLMVLRAEYPSRQDEFKQLEFRLRLCGYLLYSSNRYSLSYDNVAAMTPDQVMHELLSSQATHSIEALRPVFEVLGPEELDRSYERYVFSELCPLEISIQLLQEQRVATKQDTVLQLLRKICRGHFQYSRLIAKLQPIFQHYRHYADVQRMFATLEMAAIFFYFGINEPLSVLERLLEMKDSNIQALQEDALRLMREMLTQYCLDRLPDKRATINGVIYDFDTPEIMLSLLLHLKQRLFGRLITESLVHQMTFQHLLHFNRLQQLQQLISPRNLQQNNINFAMVEMVVAQHINELFEKSSAWLEIRDAVEYLVGLLKTKTVERRNIRNTFKLASYLDAEGCLPGKAKLPRPLNITFLYSLLNVNIQLDFSRLYKYILKIKTTSLEKVNIQTKEFLKFQGELAQRLYRKGFYQQGCELLNQLALRKPVWLTACALKIIKEVHDIPAKHREPLLTLAYEHSILPDQFEQLFAGSSLASVSSQTGVKHDLRHYYKKYIGTTQTYTVGDPNFILKEEQYTNVVAQAKFTEVALSQPNYELFFVLLANQYKRAFYYAFRERLEPAKIEFFLKECMRTQLMDPYLMIPAMFKMLLAFAQHQDFEGVKLTYKQFKEDLDEEELERLDAEVERLAGDAHLDTQLKPLLSKYHLNSKICLKCPQPTLIRQLGSRQQLAKFFEDRSHRKRLLSELIHKPSHQDVLAMEPIAKLENIDYRQLTTQILVDSLNSEVVPKAVTHVINNLSRLMSGSKTLAHQFIAALTSRVHSCRMLVLLLKKLVQLQQGSVFEEVINEDNLAILDSLSKLERSNQFYGLVPPDFPTRELRPQLSPSAKLSSEHQQQLKRILSLQNVFVLAKFMYFIYGFNERIERETLELAKHQSEELAAHLKHLQERPLQN